MRLMRVGSTTGYVVTFPHVNAAPPSISSGGCPGQG